MTQLFKRNIVFLGFLAVFFATNAGMNQVAWAVPTEPPPEPVSAPVRGVIIGPPPLAIDPPALDFGFIAPGESKTGIFTLKNPNNFPLTIVTLQPTCTCTSTTDLSGRVIAPGESIQFDASLAAAVATGPRKSTVKVIVEGFSKPVEVDVRAEVVMDLRVVPPAINVLPNVPVAGRVVIESVDKKPFRILSVDGVAPVCIGFDPAKDAARSSYLVRYDFTRVATTELPAWWLIETDRMNSPVLAVKLRCEASHIVPVVRMKEYNLNLGLIPTSSAKEFTFDLVDWVDPVASIQSMSDAFTAQLVAQDRQGKDLQIRFRVTPNTSVKGLFQCKLQMNTGDKIQQLWAYGMVKDSAPIIAPPAK